MPVDATQTPDVSPGVDTDDESLAVQMRDHDDHSSYVGLLDRHTLRVLAYCKSRVFRVSDAEDVAQEVWLKVWTRRDQFDEQGPTSFRRWLFTIAGRTCIDANRKKRPDSIEDEYLNDLGDGRASGGQASGWQTQTPDWTIFLTERQQALEACISDLPSRQQCVVRATLSGDKTGVAAEKCDCSAAQASTAKHHAIQSLSDCTERKGV